MIVGQTKDGQPQTHLTILSSVSEEYLPLQRITAPNKLAYALRWGFGVHFNRHFKRDYDMWGVRQGQIYHTLPMTDWLWFMGSDTVITNMTIDARTMCDDNFDGVIAMDVNGINNDSWFIRNTPASFAFMEKVLSLRGHPNCPTDQEAMKFTLGLLGGEPLTAFRMKYVSQRLFNSYVYGRPEYGSYTQEQKQERGGEWQHGDFVVHFAGIDLPSRMVLSQQYLNAVVE